MYWLQAFLELATEEAAVNMVKHYVPSKPLIRSQPIDIQYSNYKELQTGNLSVSILFPFCKIELHMSCVLVLAGIELIVFTVAFDT